MLQAGVQSPERGAQARSPRADFRDVTRAFFSETDINLEQAVTFIHLIFTGSEALDRPSTREVQEIKAQC